MKVEVVCRIRTDGGAWEEGHEGAGEVEIRVCEVTSAVQVREGGHWSPPVQLDRVYGADSKPSWVFRSSVVPVLEETMRGRSGAVFFFGEKSSGKWDTFLGSSSGGGGGGGNGWMNASRDRDGEETSKRRTGMLMKAVDFVYDHVKQIQSPTHQFMLRCTLCEVNDATGEVRDLLADDGGERQGRVGRVVVDGDTGAGLIAGLEESVERFVLPYDSTALKGLLASLLTRRQGDGKHFICNLCVEQRKRLTFPHDARAKDHPDAARGLVPFRKANLSLVLVSEAGAGGWASALGDVLCSIEAGSGSVPFGRHVITSLLRGAVAPQSTLTSSLCMCVSPSAVANDVSASLSLAARLRSAVLLQQQPQRAQSPPRSARKVPKSEVRFVDVQRNDNHSHTSSFLGDRASVDASPVKRLVDSPTKYGEFEMEWMDRLEREVRTMNSQVDTSWDPRCTLEDRARTVTSPHIQATRPSSKTVRRPAQVQGDVGGTPDSRNNGVASSRPLNYAAFSKRMTEGVPVETASSVHSESDKGGAGSGGHRRDSGSVKTVDALDDVEVVRVQGTMKSTLDPGPPRGGGRASGEGIPNGMGSRENGRRGAGAGGGEAFVFTGDVGLMQKQLRQALKDRKEALAELERIKQVTEKKVAKIDKLKWASKDLKRSTSANEVLKKKGVMERQAAAEAQAVLQAEVEALKVSLAKEKSRHITELAALRSENESLKKWTEGLLSELKTTQAALEEQQEGGGGGGGRKEGSESEEELRQLWVDCERERKRIAAELERREDENSELRRQLQALERQGSWGSGSGQREGGGYPKKDSYSDSRSEDEEY